jgi:hypothetical protein
VLHGKGISSALECLHGFIWTAATAKSACTSGWSASDTALKKTVFCYAALKGWSKVMFNRRALRTTILDAGFALALALALMAWSWQKQAV